MKEFSILLRTHERIIDIVEGVMENCRFYGRRMTEFSILLRAQGRVIDLQYLKVNLVLGRLFGLALE